MRPLNVSINNNILTYNNTTIVMDKKIIDYVIISEYVILLEEYTGDGDYNLVHCFDARNLNWRNSISICRFRHNPWADCCRYARQIFYTRYNNGRDY